MKTISLKLMVLAMVIGLHGVAASAACPTSRLEKNLEGEKKVASQLDKSDSKKKAEKKTK